MSLSSLPESISPWSPNIRNAYRELSSNYTTIFGYLETGSVELHRLKQYCAILMTTVFPLLLLLEKSAEEENLPLSWLEDTANKFVELMTRLDDQLKIASGQ